MHRVRYVSRKVSLSQIGEPRAGCFRTFRPSMRCIARSGRAAVQGRPTPWRRGSVAVGSLRELYGRKRSCQTHSRTRAAYCSRVRPARLHPSNSHFGGERDVEGECDRLNRVRSGQFAGRGESDSSAVWARSRTLYRGCGRPVRVCRTSGAGKTAVTSWPISAWRRFRCFSCRARLSWPISGTWPTGTAMVARTARRCLG